MISFSLRIDGRDPSLKMGGYDQKTLDKLDKLFDHIDTEINLKKDEKAQHDDIVELNYLKSEQ